MDSPLPVSSSHEGPIAEFSALRQEIESRETRRQNLFSLHITASGAVFSLAITVPKNSLFLLIIPISTYLFCSQFTLHAHAIFKIGRYIRDELDLKVPGGLKWEAWQERQSISIRIPRFAYPNLIAFPGVAIVALIWIAPTVFTGWQQVTLPSNVGVLLIWIVGLLATLFSFMLVNSTARRWYEENANFPDGQKVRANPQSSSTSKKTEKLGTDEVS